MERCFTLREKVNIMRKMAVAAVILGVIALFGVWERESIRSVTERTVDMLEVVEKCVDKKDFLKAANTLEELYKNWTRDGNLLDLFISHEKTDEIAINLLRIERHIKNRDGKMAVLTLRELMHVTEEIEKRNRIEFENIL